jgi:hypothetical protein
VLNSVSIGFTSTDAIKLQRLAAWNSRVEQMTGISPRDQANISSVMQSEFSDEVERRNR